MHYIYKLKIYDKKNELTGVSPLKGHNVIMLTIKPKDVFSEFEKIVLEVIGLKNIRLNVTNAALRTVDFKGGLDKFYLMRKKKLSDKVKKNKIALHDNNK